MFLESREADRFLIGQVAFEKTPVVFLFPGQGAQHVDMARDLYRANRFSGGIRSLPRCLKPHLDFDLLTLLYPVEDTDQAAACRPTRTNGSYPARTLCR